MRVLITTYGSRGDVQPMVALAIALRDQGADVRFCSPADQEFVDLLDDIQLQSLARKYGVSTQALINRLKNLGYIPE